MSKRTIYEILFIAIIFIGCGSDSVGGKFSESRLASTPPPIAEDIPEENSPSEPILQTGVLLDSVVSGIKYITSSQLQGKTNSLGEYNYYDGDMVEFFVGDVSLGEVKAKKLLTMSDFPYPKKVSQFLQTVDSDNFVENGIYIDSRLDSNVLLKISTFKDENSSLFAKELNIKDFDASLKNSIFIDKLMQSSKLISRQVVPMIIATKNTQKAERLKIIKDNDTQLYRYITDIDINDTDLNLTITHRNLSSRLIYRFYKKAYEYELEVKSKIENSNEFSNRLAIEYANSYLGIAKIVIKSILYTYSREKDAKREILNNLDSISADSRMVDIIEDCLSVIDFDEENKTKETQKVIECATKDIIDASYNFVPTIINRSKEAKERELAKAYLNRYLSCDSEDSRCILDRVDNNMSIIYEDTKDIIDRYKTTIKKLVDDISIGLPSDIFLNRSKLNRINRVDIDMKPLKIVQGEDNSTLWVAIDIDNKTGADINISSFEAKLIIDNREFDMLNSYQYTDLNQTYPASNRAVNIITPIVIDRVNLPQNGKAKLVLKINFQANNSTFQAIAKTAKSFDLNKLWSSANLDKFNQKAISLSKSMEVAKEWDRVYLPTVKLGFNKLDIDKIEWDIKPTNISIKSNVNGLYIHAPKLREGYDLDTYIFNISNKTDPYSQSTTFVLKVVKDR